MLHIHSYGSVDTYTHTHTHTHTQTNTQYQTIKKHKALHQPNIGHIHLLVHSLRCSVHAATDSCGDPHLFPGAGLLLLICHDYCC